MLNKLALTLRMIKIEHSIFALPFALISVLVATRGLPVWTKLIWILVAMVTARSCALAFNRIVDLKFDQANPRTQQWPLATGLLSLRFVLIFIVICSIIFIFAAYRLNRLAFYLSPVALLIIFFYSLTKRFTWFSHWFVGLALAIAPAGAWIAVRGVLSIEPILLGFAVLFWTAGFDLIYSCQDAEFDTREKLHSIPSRYGIPWALKLSKICHLLTILFLFLFGYLSNLGTWFYAGLLFTAILLFYEHQLVTPDDLSRVNEAFFAVNGLISVLLLLATSLDIYF